MQKIEKLEKYIGYEFKNKELLIQALTHPSYSNENSYERLEFLGDIILDAIVGVYLFKKYKNEDESFLTDLKSAYVNRNFLHKVGSHLNLRKYIRFKGHQISHLDNFVESIIGAIYIDGGWRRAENFQLERRGFIPIDTREPLRAEDQIERPKTVRRQGRKIGRNEPCPCGSGKKYKKCCGRGL